MEGRDTGISSSWGFIVAGIGVLGTIIAIIAAVMAMTNAGRLDREMQRDLVTTPPAETTGVIMVSPLDLETGLWNAVR